MQQAAFPHSRSSGRPFGRYICKPDVIVCTCICEYIGRARRRWRSSWYWYCEPCYFVFFPLYDVDILLLGWRSLGLIFETERTNIGRQSLEWAICRHSTSCRLVFIVLSKLRHMKVVFVFLVSILNSHLLDCLVAIMNKSLVRCAVPHNRHIILHYGMLSLANRVDGLLHENTYQLVNMESTTNSTDLPLAIITCVGYLAETIKVTLTNSIINVLFCFTLSTNISRRRTSNRIWSWRPSPTICFTSFHSEGSSAGSSPIWNSGKWDAIPEQSDNVIDLSFLSRMRHQRVAIMSTNCP